MDPNEKACFYHPDRIPEQYAADLRDAVAGMDQHPARTTAERIARIHAGTGLTWAAAVHPTRNDPGGMHRTASEKVVGWEA